MGPYENLASLIIDSVGGKDNVKSLTHCLTRLRFVLNDDKKVDQKALTGNKEVVTTQFSGGKYQVVIGTNVGDVYDEVQRQLGGAAGASDDDSEQENMSLINRFISIITQVMTPMLGVMGACGIIAALNAVLQVTGVISDGSGEALILNALGQSIFTFLPAVLGYTSAKAFGMNPFTGMLLGCALIFPGLAESMSAGDPMFTILEGTPLAMPVYQTFFGIPVLFPFLGYTSTVIPILLTTWFAAKVERVANGILPKNARFNLTPMFVLLIGGIACFLIVRPISCVLTNLLSWGLSALFSSVPVIATAVIGMVYQPLVVLGLHWSLISIGITERAAVGSTMLLGLLVPATFAHLAVCLAVARRTKNATVKQTALAAAAPTVFSIIEPSIYSIQLKAKKRFLICMIAGTLGALVIVLTNSYKYSSGMGITDIPTFINPETGDITGMLWCIVAVVVTMVTAYIMAYVTYKPEDDGVEESEEELIDAPVELRQVTVCAPVDGLAKPLTEMNDPAFQDGLLGKGICIEPSSGTVVAPCDGTLSMIFPTGHAFGITADGGAEVVVHIGIDTVSLPEGTFQKHLAQGASVKKGDPIVSFDLEALKQQGVDLDTAVFLSNSNEYLDVLPLAQGNVKAGDNTFVALPNRADEYSADVDDDNDLEAPSGLAAAAI